MLDYNLFQNMSIQMKGSEYSGLWPGYGPLANIYFFSSTIISISTAILLGSELIPTAERACLPFSPNTSTIRSENPLMTAGCLSNVGTQLTIPNTFTIRFTLD